MENALKINSSTPQATLGSLPLGPRPDSATPQTAGAHAGSAHVALSATARRLLELRDGSADIDAERVAALRDAIASGKLAIDPERIADGLIASARELLK